MSVNQHNTRDARFNNSEKKLMAKMKFPEEFATKVGPSLHGAPHQRCVDPRVGAALFLAILFTRWWEPRAKPLRGKPPQRLKSRTGMEAMPCRTRRRRSAR